MCACSLAPLARFARSLRCISEMVVVCCPRPRFATIASRVRLLLGGWLALFARGCGGWGRAPTSLRQQSRGACSLAGLRGRSLATLALSPLRPARIATPFRALCWLRSLGAPPAPAPASLRSPASHHRLRLSSAGSLRYAGAGAVLFHVERSSLYLCKFRNL